MRIVLSILGLAAVVLGTLNLSHPAHDEHAEPTYTLPDNTSAPQADVQPIAVLELFTSEGCSSCPPADRVLSQTVARAAAEGLPVLALAFHVDYWNRLGWRDAFSTAAYSDRQRRYAQVLSGRVYTPQLVINGTRELVGSDRTGLDAAIREATRLPADAGFEQLTATADGNHQWRVTWTARGDLREAEVHLVLVLREAVTEVLRGENEGRTLSHVQVVHRMKTLPALQQGEALVEADPSVSRDNLQLIALIQDRNTLRVRGGAAVSL